MGDFSPDAAIATERRHILEGERRVARQQALVMDLRERGNSRLTRRANELLIAMRASLELSRTRLLELEDRYGKAP